MANPPVLPVEPLSIHAIEQLHPARQVGGQCFDEQVVAVRHQTVSVVDPAISCHYLTEDFEESAPVSIIKGNCLTRGSVASDVVHCA